MSIGERPIGTAKGKQPDTEVLCQPPTPPAQFGMTDNTAEWGQGPPDLTGLGFGVPIGSADLSARRTFGRLKVRFNPPPPLVHTQGGTHKTQFVATAGVMSFKGPQARRYTQKAVHTEGGAHKRRSVATAGVMLFKGPQARRYTQKAVHTQGGTQKAVCGHCRSHVI